MKRRAWRVMLLVCVIGSFIALASRRCESSQVDLPNSAEPVPSKGPVSLHESVQNESVQNAVAKLADKISNALTMPRETEEEYRDKKFVDLYTTASVWIAAAIVAILLAFWILYRKEIRELITDLQKLKIGESFEFVRATVEEMKSFGEDDPEFENPVQQVAGVPLENFYSFLRYPANKIGYTLDNPFVSMNWPPLPWLRNLEARLAIAVERHKSSRHFREDRPPQNFLDTKKQLFRALVSLGNYYGFVRRASAVNRPVDLESSIYFLRRAIDIKPQAGERIELTIGYAEFCMGMVKGVLGIDLADRDVVGLQQMEVKARQQEGRDLMTDAVEQLQRATANGQQLPGQYHLQAYLLLRLGRVADAAAAWGEAAARTRPPSSKMHFNQACALAILGKYDDSLTALEPAVQIVVRLGIGSDGFDPRAIARDPHNAEGAEFRPFRTGQAQAAAARSSDGKSFDQIIA